MLKYISIIFFFLFFPQQIIPQNVTLKIGTALKTGNYYPLGESIKRILSECGISVNVIETKGSVENLILLQKGQLDLAIVQNDIAFFANQGMTPFNTVFADLQGIMTFYKEPIFIISNNPQIMSIDQLQNLKINLGPKGGGLYADAKIILNSVNLWDNMDKYTYSQDTAAMMLQYGQIQAMFTNSIPDSLFKSIKTNKLFILSLNNNFVQRLSQTYPYLSDYNEQIEKYTINTVGVKAILVCSDNLNRDLVYTITKTIYNKYDKLVFPANIKNKSRSPILLGMPLEKWHHGASDYYVEKGLLSSNLFFNFVWYFFLAVLLLVIVILGINLLLLFLRKQNIFLINFNTSLFYYARKGADYIMRFKYIIIIFLIISLFLTDLAIIQYLEHKWAIYNNSVSVFDTRSFSKNILWLFVFGGSGYDNNIFPQDSISQLLATLIPMIGLGGILTILGFLTSDHIKNHILEIKGLKTKMLKDHIIVCGWNRNVPSLLGDLMNKDYTHRKPIVVLADLEEETPLLKYNFDKSIIHYIKGDATIKKDLEKANIKDADIAVIVTDEKSTDPDARNILKTLTIENYSSELETCGMRRKKSIYTILELSDIHDASLAWQAHADEIISLNEIKSKIMVHSIHNPGVSKFLSDILNFNEFNELYSINIKNRSMLIGKTFDELLVLLRKRNIMLVSINLKGMRQSAEVNSILIENKLKRDTITNPIDEYENIYKVQEDDVLIVLAENEKIIDNIA